MKSTYEMQTQLHNAIHKNIRCGMKERDIEKIISDICPVWEGDIVSGERCGLIGGVAQDRTLREGDTLIIDIQVNSDGVWSDVTRTYFIGGASEEVRNAYKMTLEALKNGEKVLKNGAVCEDIFAAVHGSINSPYAFSHHAGHITGCAPFAKPSFLPGEKSTIATGNTVTLEPGIYVPDKFGIRVENNYRVTDNGAELLWDYPTDYEYFVL